MPLLFAYPYLRKEVIDTEPGFAFLKPLVANVPSVKSLDEAAETKSRGRSVSVDGKPKPRKQANGVQSRKRQLTTTCGDDYTDDSGPSTSKKQNGRRKKAVLTNEEQYYDQ